MPDMTRANHLTHRLLRYSTVASLTAATSLLLGPNLLHADGTVREMGGCDALNHPLCVIDFDDATGSTPEFIFTSSTLAGVFTWLRRKTHRSS